MMSTTSSMTAMRSRQSEFIDIFGLFFRSSTLECHRNVVAISLV